MILIIRVHTKTTGIRSRRHTLSESVSLPTGTMSLLVWGMTGTLGGDAPVIITALERGYQK